MAALKGFRSQSRFDPSINQHSQYLIVDWGDGTYEYQRFGLPSDRQAVISGLRAFIRKLERPDLAAAGVDLDNENA